MSTVFLDIEGTEHMKIQGIRIRYSSTLAIKKAEFNTVPGAHGVEYITWISRASCSPRLFLDV